MSMDRRIFFDQIRPLFGGRLNQPQVEGMDAILNSWERRNPNGDLRWLAYVFATAFHETARTMQPVREAFWLSENWRRRNLRYYPYYGRGYVQLTWSENYARAGSFVGVDLVRNPDLAMLPAHAATIIFVGMEAGWFRGDSRGRHTLTRYFNRNVNDPVGAREIVNGREIKTINGRRVLIASVIAGYHDAFLRAVNAGARAGVGLQRGFETAMPTSLDDDVFTEDFALGHDALLAEAVPGPRGGTFGDIAAALAAPEAMPVELPVMSDAAAPMIEDFDAHASDSSVLLDRTVEIVTAYLDGNNKIDHSDLPALITGVYRALAGLTMATALSEPPGFDMLAEGESSDLAEPEPAASKAAATRKRSRGGRSKSYADGPATEHV
ncbi:glycoside hydrolase family 19 protein [Paracoccus sp. KR1-242]|uniref:glycoside hydrolase family 19 protein n=1 Tax=Paracoccus sp. KR1-242 TaxID=3410028 RepID=UPI003C02F387